MEDKFDKAVKDMSVRIRIQEEENQKASSAQQALNAVMLGRWRNSHKTFIQPNMAKLQAALIEAGYSNVKVDSGVPSPSGFVAHISGVNPDSGAAHFVTLRCQNAPNLGSDVPWQELHIETNVGRIGGTFSPDMEEKNFKTHIWSSFFPSLPH